MTTKIKKNFFNFFFGLVATGIFHIGDCLSDAAIDVSGTQQCYNIGGHEVCYFLGSEELSDWHLAYEICERKDSTLPIIRNVDEQNALERYLKFLQLKRPDISFVWTAGKRKNFNDWMWIDSQPVSDRIRRSMLSGDSDDTHVLIIKIMKNFSIGVMEPDLLAPFLCQFHGERCVTNGRIRLTNSCVVISNFMTDWFNARSVCLARGGDLAVLNDQDLQALKKYSQQLLVYTVWIGLRKMSWFWQLDSEGKQTEEIEYEKLGRNPFTTSGDLCIHIEAFSGYWIKTECSKKHSIICQIKDTESTTKATTGSQSGTIGLLTFVLAIAGVVLVCIAFSAVVGIIAARKASANRNSERNVRRSSDAFFSHDYCPLQSQSAHEDQDESKY